MWPFIYIHTLCMQAAKALVSPYFCTGSPEPLLLDNLISNKVSYACSFILSFHREFPTFLKSGARGLFNLGEKAFGSSKLGQYNTVQKNWTAILK